MLVKYELDVDRFIASQLRQMYNINVKHLTFYMRYWYNVLRGAQ